MTTAHRPTFDPAKGKDNKAPTLSVSAHALPAHTKLKYRTTDHVDEKTALRDELLRAESEHFGQTRRQKMGGLALEDQEDEADIAYSFSGQSTHELDAEQRRKLMEKARQLDAEDDEEDERDDHSDASRSGSENNSENDSSDSEDDDDDDDGDDAEELLRELERIKRERAEEKARQEAEATEDAEQQRHEQVMTGNPLLAGAPQDFTVKRRWDDDVVFKNQAKGVDDKPKRRFVNDLIRSDFHRKFMDKYVR